MKKNLILLLTLIFSTNVFSGTVSSVFSANPDADEIRTVVAGNDSDTLIEMSCANSSEGYEMAQKRRDFFLRLKKFDFESGENTGLGSRFAQFARLDPDAARKIVTARHQYWSKLVKQMKKSAIGVRDDNYSKFIDHKRECLADKLEKMG
jgi:hypothetical protein